MVASDNLSEEKTFNVGCKVEDNAKMHFYKLWVNPRDGYCYPVYIESAISLNANEMVEKAKEKCYFLTVEDAEDIEPQGCEITK